MFLQSFLQLCKSRILTDVSSVTKDFLDSCRANTLLAELDDEEDLPEPDDDDDENEDDNQEDQEYEEVLVRKQASDPLVRTTSVSLL